MSTTITIYHATRETVFEPFSADTRIEAVYQYTRTGIDPAAPGDTLEDAFMMFNQDVDAIRHTGPGENCDADPFGCVAAGCKRWTAEGYRAARVRSLSVGDVLIIGGPAGTALPNGSGPGEVSYAVASFGFDQVTVHPDQVVEPLSAAIAAVQEGQYPFHAVDLVEAPAPWDSQA